MTLPQGFIFHLQKGNNALFAKKKGSILIVSNHCFSYVNDEQKGASFRDESRAGVHGDLNRDKFFLKISRIVAFFTGYLLKTMVLC